MDAKDLRTESVLGERIHDGRKYEQNDNTFHYDKNKPYQDIGSNSLSKVDVHIARPCAIIGPDRVVPPPESSDAYLKKTKIDPWSIFDNAYCRPPEYPPKLPNSSSPLRNISPRQTFQENMQRFLVPPRFDTVKVNEDFAAERSAHNVKNVKLNPISEVKYCDVPYNVNTKNNEQKNIRNVEACVSNVNPSLVHNSVYQAPGDVNMRPPRPFEAPDLYQYQEYANCPGPKQMPAARSVRMIQDEAGHMYPSPYYQTGNVRFKPYTPVKERYPPQRYDLNGYVNPYHTPLPYQTHTKYEIPKPLPPHPCAGYPQIPVKYIDNRMNESVMENYQRSNFQVNYNAHYRGPTMQQPYVPIPGNCLQNKNMHPYTTDNTYKQINSNKMSYENHKMFEYDRARNTYMTENFYPKEIPQSVPMKNQMLPNSYPPMNCYPIHSPHYYKKDIKNFDYYPNYRNLDISNPNNHLQKLPPQFSPKTIAISPSDSITSNETHGNNQEDCGYVSQSSTTSVRSIDSVNRIPNDPYRKYDYRGTHVVRTPTFMGRAHLNSSNIDNKQIKKGIDVRQFLQMWNEGEEENTENNKEITKTVTTIPTQLGNVNNDQEQLYVLGLVNVPSEELDKYEHIQKISKLPDNIKGYNNIELLYQFEEAIESSNRNTFNMKTINPRDLHIPQKDIAPLNKNMPRPVSPLDVEAKISQSVIHKEVGCNFEIRPCSPKVLNVEVATSVQSIIGERAIEKVTNPLMIKSPLLLENIENKLNNNQELKAVSSNENVNVTSCKMVDIHSTNHLDNSIIKTDYSVQDLESNSGVCLASLPRLDNDIELSFPEVNQQFINAIKVESVITTTPKDLSPNNYIQNDGIKSHGNTEMCQFSPNASENSFSKLSKYRKQRNINKEFKQSDSDICAQALRTDSVIIKNPENIKSTENNQNVFSTFESDLRKPQSPINLTTEFEETNKKIISIDCVNSGDEAIDFSLNPSNNLKCHGTFDDNNHKDNFNILSSICESNKLELGGSLHDNRAENFQISNEKLLQNDDISLNIVSLSTESKRKSSCDISPQKPKDRSGVSENGLENCCELLNSNQNTKKEEILKKEICKFGYDVDSKHMSSILKQTDENVSEYKAKSPNIPHKKTHQSVKLANATEVSKAIKDKKKNPHNIQVNADKIISISSHEPDKFEKKYNDIAKNTDQFHKKRFSPWIQKLVFGDILYNDFNVDKHDRMIRFNHNCDDSSILKTNRCVDAYINSKEILNEVLITDHTMNIQTEINDYENCNFNESNLDMTVVEDKTTRETKTTTNEEDFFNTEISDNSLVLKTNIDDPIHLNDKDNNFSNTEVMDLNIAKEYNCDTDGTNKNNDAIIDLDSQEDNNINKTKDLDLLIIKNDYDTQATDKNNSSLESITNKCLVEDAIIDLDSHEDNKLNKTNDLNLLITKNDCDAQITDKNNPSLELVKNKCLVKDVVIDLDSHEYNCNETKNMGLLISKHDYDAQITDKNNASFESVKNICLVEDAVIYLDSHENNNFTKTKNLDLLITKNDHDVQISDKNNSSLESIKSECLMEDAVIDVNPHEDIRFNKTKDLDSHITKDNLCNDSCEIRDTEKYNSTCDNKAVTLELCKNQISVDETNYTECLKNNSTKRLNITESNNKENVVNNSEHLILYKTQKQETEDTACFETQVLKNDDSELEINKLNTSKINKKEIGVKYEDSDSCKVQETFTNYKTRLETSSLMTEKNKNKNVEFIEKEKCLYDYEQYKNGVYSNELKKSSLKENVKFYEENTPKIRKHIQTCRNKVESCSEINNVETLTEENRNLPINTQLCDSDPLNNEDDKVHSNSKEHELRFTEENISTEDFMRNIQVTEKSHINKEYNVALKEKPSSEFELNASTVVEARKELTESGSDRINNSIKEKTIPDRDCDSQILEERNFILETYGDYVGEETDTDKYICSTQLVSVAGTSEVDNSIQPLLELHVVKSLKQLASAVISSIDQNLSRNEPVYDDKRTQIAPTSNDFDDHTKNSVDVDVTKESNLKLYTKRLKITNHKPFSPNKRRFLKRSLSETALDDYSNNSKLEILENFSKKRKIDTNGENLIEAQVISENLCNIFQNNRRNSVSTLYNDENVSFCILIDDDCIITEGDETENICFTEIDGNDFDDSINQTINNDGENLELVAEVNDKESLREFPNQFILECSGEEFLDDPSWVEDVACMETIVADDVAEDIVISTSSSPKETDYSDHESYNEESGFFGNEINHHTDKVKHIYGEQMCSNDAQLVEQLYRTPQMNVNKTLKERESESVEELCYDKDSLEKVLSEPNEHDTFCKTNSNKPEDISFELNVGISKEPDHKDNSGLEYTEKYFLPVVDENMFSDVSDLSLTNKHTDDIISEAVREDTQIPTVHSCESSLDDVFCYNHNKTCPKYASSSSSPEVSSTTSEERQSSSSGILLKITNYNGSRISQISDVSSDTSGKIRCKFTEANDYLYCKSSSNPTKTLITKAAQKYIPPLKESFNDLKVKLPLPQKRLIKLKQLKVSKERPNLQRIIKINKNLPKKSKPKFEDVLKSIDEIQIKMHKEKSKKPKKAIPKVVIKKSENGSHYASTSDDSYNPDLTGRKWQPWVFIEKNKFIDKMVLKNKTRAIYNHRKKTYVLVEKFHKYKAVSNNTKFVISQPKIDNTCKGQLKYTIRLKHGDK